MHCSILPVPIATELHIADIAPRTIKDAVTIFSMQGAVTMVLQIQCAQGAARECAFAAYASHHSHHSDDHDDGMHISMQQSCNLLLRSKHNWTCGTTVTAPCMLTDADLLYILVPNRSHADDQLDHSMLYKEKEHMKLA